MGAPPAWLFGPVWTVLYILIAVSCGYVGYLVIMKMMPAAITVPFALNLFFNLAYTLLQFGLKNLPLASAGILLVLGTLIWALVAIYPYAQWASFINIPYLLWVCFATLLQLAILYLNRKARVEWQAIG